MTPPGFEPAIAAVKGRCPDLLDDDVIKVTTTGLEPAHNKAFDLAGLPLAYVVIEWTECAEPKHAEYFPRSLCPGLTSGF